MLKQLLEKKHELDFMLLEYKRLTETYTGDDKQFMLEVKAAEIRLKEYQIKKFEEKISA